MRKFLASVLFLALFCAMGAVLTKNASAQVSDKSSQPPAVTANNDLAAAAQIGAQDGAKEGTTGTLLASYSLSVFPPGLGGLIIRQTVGGGEVKPNFVQETFLKDKSPDYVNAWAAAYKEAAVKKHRRAALTGGLAGAATYFIIKLAL